VWRLQATVSFEPHFRNDNPAHQHPTLFPPRLPNNPKIPNEASHHYDFAASHLGGGGEAKARPKDAPLGCSCLNSAKRPDDKESEGSSSSAGTRAVKKFIDGLTKVFMSS